MISEGRCGGWGRRNVCVEARRRRLRFGAVAGQSVMMRRAPTLGKDGDESGDDDDGLSLAHATLEH